MHQPRTLLILGLALSPAFAANVVLQNATATFSQTEFGNFFASTMIDGSLTTGVDGWAIFDANGVTSAQTAVFETVTDQGSAGGTTFTFRMHQLHQISLQHTVGRFRLSITTDNRSTFADGLQTGGDVTATWVILTPLTASGTNGPTLTVLGDQSILASGTSPGTSVYTVTAFTPLTAITGIRLEVLEDASLPTNGPGRAPSNGNFVVTEFQVDAQGQAPPVIPAPSTWILMLTALLALAGWQWWRTRPVLS